MKRAYVSIVLLVVVFLVARAPAQQADVSLVTLDRLFDSRDFQLDRFGPARWTQADHYTTVERSGEPPRQSIVRHDARTGAPEVLVAAERLIPPGGKEPLAIDDYQ